MRTLPSREAIVVSLLLATLAALLGSVRISETVNTRTVDVHMSRIRRKLEINPDMGYRIKTIYQYGYRLEKVREHAVS